MGFVINLKSIVPSVEDLRTSLPIGLSPLGTPIFDDIYFPEGQYTDENGTPIPYTGLRIQSAKVVVTQAKNIVKTEVAGFDGTIKEYISKGDFSISINAKLTELLDVFPADQLAAWSELSKVPENIKIVSKFINEYFDIYDVVVTNFSVSPIQGSINEINLNIDLLSDKDIDLTEFLEVDVTKYYNVV